MGGPARTAYGKGGLPKAYGEREAVEGGKTGRVHA